ncbi:MAG: DUF3990 domain-containing protein [Oscillospiraceae bacterium]|nr:DUF3990 domain-containing protein [Oscillospiraceae bacterium]
MENITENKITLYHGSDKILKTPEFGKGEINNDYGQGFYCTKNKGLAGEWAVLWNGKDGYINEYSFDYTNLNVLYLNQLPIENWVAVLLDNRNIYSLDDFELRISVFLQKYLVDISDYDIIEGWRADDAFFTYITDFISNALSLENLKLALNFGGLGNQICLKSQKAFDIIEFTAYYPASASRFLKSAQDRDLLAKQQYRQMYRKAIGTVLENLIGKENL